MRTNIAVRTRDLKKLTDKWGEGRVYSPVLLKSLVARAVANYFGIDTLTQIVEPLKSKPGRPCGIRGFKRGTGRRSVEGEWAQVEVDEAGDWLEACSELMAIEHKWLQRPSLALTLAIIASKSPRALDQWKGKAPRWAAQAWIAKNSFTVDDAEDLTLPIDDYDTVPKSQALDSSEDFITFTEEQIKEINNV